MYHTLSANLPGSGAMGNPTEAFVRFTTFDSSMAMVMGSTPPGTGVMAETTWEASSKWTSPN